MSILQVVLSPVSQSIQVVREEDDEIGSHIRQFLERLKFQMQSIRIQKSQ